MGLEQFAIKAATELTKGMEKVTEALKEGADLKSAFNEGVEHLKEAGLSELRDFLSPSEIEKLDAVEEKLDKVEENLAGNSGVNIEQQGADLSESEAYIQQLSQKIDEMIKTKLESISEGADGTKAPEIEESLLQEVKKGLSELEDILVQIQSIKKIIELLSDNNITEEEDAMEQSLEGE